MKTSVFCENSYKNSVLFSPAEIENIAEKFLLYAINNSVSTFFTDENDYSLEVMLCDDEFIHGVNKEYRGIDRATDVITFALFADSEEKIVADNVINLGQIIISMDKVKLQAEENGISEEKEFLNLLSHGILHLLGIDHKTDKELQYMLELQDKMIESVNYVKV